MIPSLEGPKKILILSWKTTQDAIVITKDDQPEFFIPTPPPPPSFIFYFLVLFFTAINYKDSIPNEQNKQKKE